MHGPDCVSTPLLAVEEDASNEIDWERLFQGAEQEQFRLLDVSTNADQMGVSFAWFDPDLADRPDSSPVVRVRGGTATPAYPLQVHDLDLSAREPLRARPSPCPRSAGSRWST